MLEVDATNQAAVGVYQSLGFKTVKGSESYIGKIEARRPDGLAVRNGCRAMEGLALMVCKTKPPGPSMYTSSSTCKSAVQTLPAAMVFSRITYRAKTTPTCGRLELLGLIKDYRQGLVPLIAPDAAQASPQPLAGARPGRHQQVYLTSVSQGADAAESLRGPTPPITCRQKLGC